MIGNKYGKLTVLKFISYKGRYCRYLCLCDCGKEVTRIKESLLRDQISSCGCVHKEKMKKESDKKMGGKYGKLTVVKILKDSKDNTLLCGCECGNRVTRRRSALLRAIKKKHVSSCGCTIATSTGQGGLSTLYNQYKHSAKKRNLEMSMPKEIFRTMVIKDCYYCGSTPSRITYGISSKSHDAKQHSAFTSNGIDRVNPNLGYTLGNVVPCCFECNWMKATRTLEEFEEWIDRAYKTMKRNQLGLAKGKMVEVAL